MSLLASQITKSPGTGHHDRIYLSCKPPNSTCPEIAKTGREVPMGVAAGKKLEKGGEIGALHCREELVPK